MKLRKFFGLTSRSVLEQVRAELGADAVIVANHATTEGVEVTALAGDAIDTLLAHTRGDGAPAREPAPAAPPAEPPVPAAVRTRTARPPMAVPPDEAVAEAPPAPASIPAAPAQDDLAPRMMAEMAAMREAIEAKLALLAWSDTLRRRPLATRLVKDLLAAGYSPALARTVTERLPDDMNAAEARDWVVKVLGRNLKCIATADEIVARGGIYALVGPTGVGKTTTTAKLAARCAVRYGAHRLALITTDSFRIGAQDQLRIYARILGVAVHNVSDRHDLKQALDAVRGRHLVLIDTVGMGQRDARVAEQSMLLAQPEIRRLLLLNAAAQGETLDEVVDAYARVPETIGGEASPLAGCIVTKQDEATRLGGALDVAIRHRLPLHYVTTGQQVPEDVYVPEADLMIQRSLRHGARASAFALGDDDLPLALDMPARAAHA
ncbi:MAG TPA: flagellar biosynthesis protein FlhF [Casimicrobiaceae bacterium]|nr:flagellar biosynthesis protein FlhF [Casimicrobiaceae bacterium]